jgi:hypothetical protein
LYRLLLASAFAIATLGAITTFDPAANAMPNPAPAQITNQTSAIVQVDARCGRGRHYVPRHRYHGHWVAGHCARG